MSSRYCGDRDIRSTRLLGERYMGVLNPSARDAAVHITGGKCSWVMQIGKRNVVSVDGQGAGDRAEVWMRLKVKEHLIPAIHVNFHHLGLSCLWSCICLVLYHHHPLPLRTYRWRPEVNGGDLPRVSPLQFSRQCFLPNLELRDVTMLTGQWAPVVFLSPGPSAGTTGTWYFHVFIFGWTPLSFEYF